MPEVLLAFNEFYRNYKKKGKSIPAGKVIGLFKSLAFTAPEEGYVTDKFINLFCNSLSDAFDLPFVKNPLRLFYCDKRNYIQTINIANYNIINFEQLLEIRELDYNTYNYIILRITGKYLNISSSTEFRFRVNSFTFEFMSSIVFISSPPHVYAIINYYNEYYTCDDHNAKIIKTSEELIKNVNKSFIFVFKINKM